MKALQISYYWKLHNRVLKRHRNVSEKYWIPYDPLFTRSKRLLSSVFLNIEFFIWMTSVADPGSDAFLTPRSGMGKKSRSGSGMNIPDHISDKDPGSATLNTMFLFIAESVWRWQTEVALCQTPHSFHWAGCKYAENTRFY